MTLGELKSSISKLSNEDLARFRKWFIDYDSKQFSGVYGDWRPLEELELADFKEHNIWVWCMLLEKSDGPIGGDESSMRPLLSTNNVTAEQKDPMILLRIQGTTYFASAIYDDSEKKLSAISVYKDQKFVRSRSDLTEISGSPIFVSVPRINGIENVKFRGVDKHAGEADMIIGRKPG